MEITELHAEDVFPGEDELKFYQEGMSFFYSQLVHLNVNIFILDYVLEFPYHLFTELDDTIFFRMVFENFFNASLLIISRIATDQEGEVFTLQRFKNRIRQTILPEHKQQFDKRMKQFKFTNETRSLLDKVHTLRNRQIAHVTEDFAFGRTQAPVFVFRDLKSLRDRLNALLDALSFNVKYMKLPLRYHPDVQYSLGYDTRPDIENILDMIAERSTLLNMPENDPNGWKWRRDLLSERDLELLNRYRRKFNLQEV